MHRFIQLKNILQHLWRLCFLRSSKGMPPGLPASYGFPGYGHRTKGFRIWSLVFLSGGTSSSKSPSLWIMKNNPKHLSLRHLKFQNSPVKDSDTSWWTLTSYLDHKEELRGWFGQANFTAAKLNWERVPESHRSFKLVFLFIVLCKTAQAQLDKIESVYERHFWALASDSQLDIC